MMLRCVVVAAALAGFGMPGLAEPYTAELGTAHEVAHGWKSQQSGSAVAKINLSEDGTTLDFDLVVTGVKLDELAAAGKDGAFGPIHIHNTPQGGPNFFVLQLPGVYVPSEDGFTLTLTDWVIEAPKGGAKVDAAFVVEEIRSGRAYVGLHTHNMLCADSEGKSVPCAAPATALSGAIVKAE